MSRFTSYYLYQKYEKVGDGEWTPVYPNEYSISGDTNDPMPLVVKTNNDPECGYYPPIYRWTNSDQTICIYQEDNPYANEYLTIDIVSAGTLSFEITSTCGGSRKISYSIGTTATTTPSSWSAPTDYMFLGAISDLQPGRRIFIKGLNNEYGYCCTWKFGGTAKFNVHGNIMSLIYGDDFVGHYTLLEEETFNGLFMTSKVVDASNLILPSQTLTRACYAEMFKSCVYLTAAPELPALTLADSCYAEMFYGCRSLTTAPELPATTLANSCYGGMFNRCSGLTTSPDLPAETLVYNSYNSMFYNCSSLNSIKCLATDISATNCTNLWVSGVSNTGTFTKAESMNNWTIGTSGIPSGWATTNV